MNPTRTTLIQRRLARAGKPRRGGSRLRLVSGGIMVGLVVLIAVAAPVLAPHDPYAQALQDGSLPPLSTGEGGTFYLMGTDDLGRDLLSRFLYGARYPLLVGLLAVVLGGLIGITSGVLAGYFRGGVDTVLSRIADIQMSIPGILVAISLLAFGGGSITMLVLVIAVTGWPTYFRLVRVETMAIRDRAFIESAIASSATNVWVIVKHVLPNIAGIAFVVATLDLSRAVLVEAGLSFLGLGIQPPTADWGVMVAMGQGRLATEWWISTLPGLGIVMLVFGINLMGDWIADRSSVERPLAMGA